MLDPGFASLIHRILNERPVDDGQHLFGHGFCGGQKSGSEAGDRKHGSLDAFYHGFLLVIGNTPGDWIMVISVVP
jgi:hypothetical protein